VKITFAIAFAAWFVCPSGFKERVFAAPNHFRNQDLELLLLYGDIYEQLTHQKCKQN
jgi:hypothetical protein